MAETQPIRTKEQVEQLKHYFFDRGEIRNYVMIVVGLNIPLRISDILSIQWGDVYDFTNMKFRKHLFIAEQKTKKANILAINTSVMESLKILLDRDSPAGPNEFLFKAQKYSTRPISRVTAYLIIRNAARDLGLEHIGCHSLRKTFGYHAWKEGIPLALIMSIYNHSSIQMTKRYLGISQDEKDSAIYMINL